MKIFVSDKLFVKFYTITSAIKFPSALREFEKYVGAHEILVANPHRSSKSKDVKDFCNKIGTTLRLLEQNTQWENRAEVICGAYEGGMPERH